jgi:hypothetical protein
MAGRADLLDRLGNRRIAVHLGCGLDGCQFFGGNNYGLCRRLRQYVAETQKAQQDGAKKNPATSGQVRDIPENILVAGFVGPLLVGNAVCIGLGIADRELIRLAHQFAI